MNYGSLVLFIVLASASAQVDPTGEPGPTLLTPKKPRPAKQSAPPPPVLTTAAPPTAPPPTVMIPTPSSSDVSAVSLTLIECIRMALEKNLDLSIQRLQPLLADTSITTALGAYDPRLRLDSQYGESSSPRLAEQVAADGRSSVLSQSTTYSSTLVQKTPIGSTFNVGANTRNSESTFNNFRDEYSSFFGGNFTQSLLRNFGFDANLAPIRISRIGRTAADAAFQFQIERTITDVALAYYELIYTQDDLKARQQAFDLAEQLLQDNKTRVEIGTMSSLDVSQASADRAARREAVIRAERAIRDQENVLKRLITYDLGNWLEKRIVPAERPKENYQAQPATASIGEALQQRADLKEAVQRAEQQNIQVKYAQNQLLPQLDLRASYGYAGRDLEIDRSFGNAAKADDPQWFVGLFLEVPFGNREQRGRLEAAKLTKEQTLLELKRLEQTIIVEVDNAAGQVETNRQRVVAARAAREFAEESLKAEQEKLQAGTSTSYVVLQLQRDLTEARIRELRAMADLEKSRAELLRVQGTAFRHYSIILDKTTP